MNEVVPVETVRPGDEILVHPTVGLQVVSAVHDYDDAVVIVYFHHSELVFENRASAAKGPRVEERLVEKSLAGKPHGELVHVRRGGAGAAVDVRAELEREQAARFARLAERAEARQVRATAPEPPL